MKAIDQCIDAVILITLRCEMVVSEAQSKSEKFYKMCMLVVCLLCCGCVLL